MLECPCDHLYFLIPNQNESTKFLRRHNGDARVRANATRQSIFSACDGVHDGKNETRRIYRHINILLNMEDLFERLSEATKKHDQIVYNLRVADEIGAMRLSEERRHMTEECKPGIDYNF